MAAPVGPTPTTQDCDSVGLLIVVPQLFLSVHVLVVILLVQADQSSIQVYFFSEIFEDVGIIFFLKTKSKTTIIIIITIAIDG